MLSFNNCRYKPSSFCSTFKTKTLKLKWLNFQLKTYDFSQFLSCFYLGSENKSHVVRIKCKDIILDKKNGPYNNSTWKISFDFHLRCKNYFAAVIVTHAIDSNDWFSFPWPKISDNGTRVITKYCKMDQKQCQNRPSN